MFPIDHYDHTDYNNVHDMQELRTCKKIEAEIYLFNPGCLSDRDMKGLVPLTANN